MGCATSKQSLCRNCKSPVARSYSMHVHHPPQREGDTYHVVALTSSTLGSIKLDPVKLGRRNGGANGRIQDDDGSVVSLDDRKRSKEFPMGMIEAKTWSDMISEKITKVVPKTPVRTPPGEPETINAWELMEGLEDASPLQAHHFRSFSFHVAPNSMPSPCNLPRSKLPGSGDASPKPTCTDAADKETSALISEFDPDVISKFRKALEELPPANPFHLNSPAGQKQQAAACNGDFTVSKFTSKRKDRVVLYFTSLRGVRKTYENCCHVRVILKGIGIRVDERDVSMDSGFKEELKELSGDHGFRGGLPRVFVGKKYIGGAEEIRRMHEEGRLEKLLEDCEMAEDGGTVCETCGDVRFVPCDTCSGSCKIYFEADYDDEFYDETASDCGFQRCPDCNENGIIRCPFCCE
ncbi:uncharacterized protein At5g39865 [Diospyros lotus]|uniref:uncharacterized protein At5g39865 n=1 Tax=Diospyros lotus TaxID=55363 RepID=UPI002254BFC1|nr:uncharacterized protein At5g39865 [Diospyros lotus]